MKYGIVKFARATDESTKERFKDCSFEIEFFTTWDVVPRLIDAMKDEPIAHLLGEGVEAEFATQGNSIQCCNCGDWFTVENMPPRFCPRCGARFTNEVG